MDIFTLFLTVGVCFSMIFAVVAMIVSSRNSEAKFRESLVAALGPGVDWDEKRQTFRQVGMNFRYQKYQGSRNSPPSFSLFLECPVTGGEFEIATESAVDRFFKNIGITLEVQTGDEVFDGRCFIASNTPEFAKECFASAERRETVKRLWDIKVRKIVYRGQSLALIWQGQTSHADGVSNLKESLDLMAVLIRDLPQYHEIVSLAGSGPAGPAERNLVMGIAGASSALGVLSLIWTNLQYPLFDPAGLFLFSLKFSVPALAVFIVLAVRTLSGRSRSHRDLLLACGLALAGFLFTGYGVVALYNGMADLSAPASHIALIQNKEMHRSKNSRSYHLYVRSWKSGRALEDLNTGSGIFNWVIPGKHEAVVRTRAGKLGFEWLVSYQVRDKQT